jgi:hypothetical protein
MRASIMLLLVQYFELHSGYVYDHRRSRVFKILERVDPNVFLPLKNRNNDEHSVFCTCRNKTIATTTTKKSMVFHSWRQGG